MKHIKQPRIGYGNSALSIAKRVLLSTMAVSALAATVLHSSAAHATPGACPNSNNCYVTEVYMEGSSFVWVGVNGKPVLSTACTNNTYMGFSVLDDRGKGLLAIVQAALLSGRLVSLYGTGSCIGPGGSQNLEELKAIWVKP